MSLQFCPLSVLTSIKPPSQFTPWACSKSWRYLNVRTKLPAASTLSGGDSSAASEMVPKSTPFQTWLGAMGACTDQMSAGPCALFAVQTEGVGSTSSLAEDIGLRS